MTSPAPAILLVEDDEFDILSFLRQAKKTGLSTAIVVARDGSEALSILGRFAAERRPFVVLTDINMPGISGHELVEAIRADGELCNSIVFVVSSSALSSDITRAYRSNVAGYIVKDSGGAGLANAVEMLRHYMSAVIPPRTPCAGFPPFPGRPTLN